MRLKDTGCFSTWQTRIKCADADPAPQDLFHKTDYRGALIHLTVPSLRTAPSPMVAQTCTEMGTNQRNQV